MTFETEEERLADVTLALRGAHQVGNATVALCLMTALNGVGLRLETAAMRAGLSDARWPGRLERLEWQGSDVLLDAAHNPAGARALANYLGEIGWTDVTLVLGVMRDKDVTGILSALLPCCATLVCTTPPSPRARDAESLAALASGMPSAPAHIVAIAEPAAAMAYACRAQGRVVAAGSIFLIGPLRGILR